MASRAAPCVCADCAHLDLEFPGEGIQLALVLPLKKSRAGRRRKDPAPAASTRRRGALQQAENVP